MDGFLNSQRLKDDKTTPKASSSLYYWPKNNIRIKATLNLWTKIEETYTLTHLEAQVSAVLEPQIHHVTGDVKHP